MPNEVIAIHRQRVPNDPRSDAELTILYGDSAPHLLEKYPAFQAEYQSFKQFNDDLNKPSIPEEFPRAFSRGVDQTQQTFYGAGGLAAGLAERTLRDASANMGGDPVLDTARKGADAMKQWMLRRAVAQEEEIAENQPTVKDWRGVKDAETASRYVLSGLGEVAPSVIEAIGTSVIGGLAGGAAGTAAEPVGGTVIGAGAGAVTGLVQKQAVKSLLKKLVRKELDDLLADPVKKQVVREELSSAAEALAKGASAKLTGDTALLIAGETKALGSKYGVNLAAALNSYAMNSGEIYADIMRDPKADPDRALDAAFFGGAIAAVPDSYLPSHVANRFFQGAGSRAVSKEAKKGFYGYLTRTISEAAQVIPAEGITEGFQEWVNVLSGRYAAGQKLRWDELDEEERARLIQASILGGMGGSMAAPIAAISQPKTRVVTEEQKEAIKEKVKATEKYTGPLSTVDVGFYLDLAGRDLSGLLTPSDRSFMSNMNPDQRNAYNLLRGEFLVSFGEKPQYQLTVNDDGEIEVIGGEMPDLPTLGEQSAIPSPNLKRDEPGTGAVKPPTAPATAAKPEKTPVSISPEKPVSPVVETAVSSKPDEAEKTVTPPVEKPVAPEPAKPDLRAASVAALQEESKPRKKRERKKTESPVAGSAVPPAVTTAVKPEEKPVVAPAPAPVVAPAEAVAREPLTGIEALNQAAEITIKGPSGATMLQATDKQGRKTVQPIKESSKGANVFRGADIVSVVPGVISGAKKEFKAVKGAVEITERGKVVKAADKPADQPAAQPTEKPPVVKETFTTEKAPWQMTYDELKDFLNSHIVTADGEYLLQNIYESNVGERAPRNSGALIDFLLEHYEKYPQDLRNDFNQKTKPIDDSQSIRHKEAKRFYLSTIAALKPEFQKRIEDILFDVKEPTKGRRGQFTLEKALKGEAALTFSDYESAGHEIGHVLTQGHLPSMKEKFGTDDAEVLADAFFKTAEIVDDYNNSQSGLESPNIDDFFTGRTSEGLLRKVYDEYFKPVAKHSPYKESLPAEKPPELLPDDTALMDFEKAASVYGELESETAEAISNPAEVQRRYRATLENAVSKKQPVNAYGWTTDLRNKVPEGYVREGDLYVYRPAEKPVKQKADQPEARKAKEPWEMTKEKYRWSKLGDIDSSSPTGRNIFSQADRTHTKSVEQALREGKPVPPEVLADYPDLKPSEGKKEKAVDPQKFGFKKDKDGSIIAYHGTDREIASFDASAMSGAFFTPSYQEAFDYGLDAAKRNSETGGPSDVRVYEVRIRPRQLVELSFDREGNVIRPIADSLQTGPDALIVSNDLEVIDPSIINDIKDVTKKPTPAPAPPSEPQESQAVEAQKERAPQPVSKQTKAPSGLEPKQQKKFLLEEIDNAFDEALDERPKVDADADIEALDDVRWNSEKESLEDFNKRRNETIERLAAKYEVEWDYPPRTPTKSMDPEEQEPKVIPGGRYSHDGMFRILRGYEDRRNDDSIIGVVELAVMRQSPHVTIEIPGDGTFVVINTKAALNDFKKRADKFPVSTPKAKGPSTPKLEETSPAAIQKRTPEGDVDALQLSASTNPERYVLTFVVSTGNNLVSTDGRRLTIVDRKGFGGTDEEPVFLKPDGTKAKFKKGEEPKYPSYKQVIPDEADYVTAFQGLDTARLFHLLKQAEGVFPKLPKKQQDRESRSVSVYMDAEGRLGLSTHDRDGDQYATGITETSKVIVSLHVDYFIDAVQIARKLGAEKFDFLYNDEFSPVIFKGNGWKHVLMPMRMSGGLASAGEDGPSKFVRKTLGLGKPDDNIKFNRPDSVPFYSRITRTVEESAQQKASGLQWKGLIRNSKLGVNLDEYALASVDDLEDGKVYTKAEVLEYLRVNEVKVEEVTLHAGATPVSAKLIDPGSATTNREWLITYSDGSTAPVFQQDTEADALDMARYLSPSLRTAQFAAYQEPGAKEGSYREVLLTVPKMEGMKRPDFNGWLDFVYPNWRGFSDENIASIRKYFDNLYSTLPMWRDGHAQYSDIANPIVHLRFNERTTADGKRMLFLEEVQAPLGKEWLEVGGVKFEGANRRARAEAYVKEHGGVIEKKADGEFGKMPALFRDNWREIAFKWALHHAAANGFDTVGWTTGEMQADRYDLSGQLDAIAYVKRDYGYTLTYHKYESEEQWDLLGNEIQPDQLEKYVGKEVAAKILRGDGEKNEYSKSTILRGVDLKVGGEGLKKLYDVDFRNVVNKLPVVRKSGQKVGSTEIEVSPITSESLTDLGKRTIPVEKQSVPSLDITPEMRDALIGGQPRFNLPESQPAQRTIDVPSKPIAPWHGAVLSALAANGLNVRVVQQDITGAAGEFAREQGAAADVANRVLTQVVGTVIGVQNVQTALHEAGHFVFADLSPADRARALQAVQAVGDIELGLDRLTPGFDATSNPVFYREVNARENARERDNASRAEERLVEATARSLVAAGFDPAQANTWAQALVRLLKDLWLRASMLVQKALDGSADPDTALRHFRLQVERFLAGDSRRLSIVNLIGGPKLRTHELAQTFTPMPGHLIPGYYDYITGKSVYGAVVPDSVAALRFNIAAHHGTPHRIEGAFSTEKIGTGEGAQVYGWGLYFAGNQEVAMQYQRNLTDSGNRERRGRRAAELLANEQGRANTVEWDNSVMPFYLFAQQYKDGEIKDSQIPEHILKKLPPQEGNTYTVNLKVEPEDLLDWDSMVGEYDTVTRRINAQFQKEFGVRDFWQVTSQSGQWLYATVAKEIARRTKNLEQYNIAFTPRESELASKFLLRAGIKGIRYLDQGSRANQGLAGGFNVLDEAGDVLGYWRSRDDAEAFMAGKQGLRIVELEREKPTYNYVIFDDKDIEITHENGSPISTKRAEEEGVIKFNRPTRVDEIPQVDPGQSEYQMAPALAASRYFQGALDALYQAYKADRPDSPMTSEDFISFILPKGVDNPQAVIDEIAKELDAQGLPMPDNATFEQLPEAAKGQMAQMGIKTLMKLKGKMAERMNDAALDSNPLLPGSAASKFDRLTKRIQRLTENHTDADAIFNDIKNDLDELLHKLRDDIKAQRHNSQFGGALTQVIRNLTEQMTGQTSRDYEVAIAKLVKALTDDKTAATKFVNLLEWVANQDANWKELTPTQIRDQLDATVPAELKPAWNQDATKVVVIAFAKSNATVMANLELRRTKTGEELAAIKELLAEAKKATASGLSKARTLANKLATKKAAALKLLDQLDKLREQAQRLNEELVRHEEFSRAFNVAGPVMDEHLAALERQLNAQIGVFNGSEDEVFYHAATIDASQTGIVNNQRRLRVQAPDAKNIETVKQVLADNAAWLKAHGEGNKLYRSAIYNRLEQQQEVLRDYLIENEHSKTRNNVWIRMTGFIQKSLRQIGTPASKKAARRIVAMEQRREIGRVLADSVSTNWLSAQHRARKALGIPSHQTELFQELFYDNAFNFVEKHKAVSYEEPTTDKAWARVMDMWKEALYDSPITGPMLRKAGAKGWQALEQFYTASVSGDGRLVNFGQESTVKVEDDFGLFRNVKGVPGFEMMRVPSNLVIRLFNGMRDRWSPFVDAFKRKDIVVAYEEDPDAIAASLQQFFDPTVWEDFVKALVYRDGASPFNAPANNVGEYLLADRDQVIRVFERTAPGDVVDFARNLYQLTAADGSQSEAEFVAETLDTFVNYYRDLRGMFGDKSVTALFNFEGAQHLLMDKRRSESFPKEWLSFRRYDKASTRAAVNLISFHSAFGRNMDGMVADLIAAKEGLRSDIDRYGKIWRKINTENIGAGKRVIERLYDEALKKEGLEPQSIKKLKRDALEIETASNMFHNMIKAYSGMPLEMRTWTEIISTMVVSLLQSPGTALIDTIALFKPLQTFGPSTIAFRMIKENWKSGAKELLGSYGSLFFQNLKMNADNYRLRHMAGIVEPEFEATLADKLAAVTEELPRIEGEGLGIGRRARKLARGARAIITHGTKGKNKGQYIRARLFAPFVQESMIAHIAVIDGLQKTVSDMLLRGAMLWQNNPGLIGEPITAEQLGYGRHLGGLIDDVTAFERMKHLLNEHNLSFENLVSDYLERKKSDPNAPIWTKRTFQDLSVIGPTKFLQEGSMLTRPASWLTDSTMMTLVPLLGWAVAQTGSIATGWGNVRGETKSWSARLKGQDKDFNTMMLGMLALVPIGLAYAWLREQYDEEIVGKKPNIMRFGEGNAGLVMIDKLSRVGQFGIAGDFLNATVNQDVTRDFSADSRVFAISAALAVKNAAGTWLRQGDATWQSVWRPLLSSVGGSGYLQFADTVNNALGLDNPEARTVARINAQNWLRSAGRQLNMDVRTGRGMASIATPTKPWVQEMLLAALANDAAGFQQAHRKAVAAAKEDGKDDPERYVRDMYAGYNPLRTVFRTLPTETEFRKLLGAMSSDGAKDVQEAVRLYQYYAGRLGIRTGFGKPEMALPTAATPLPMVRRPFDYRSASAAALQF